MYATHSPASKNSNLHVGTNLRQSRVNSAIMLRPYSLMLGLLPWLLLIAPRADLAVLLPEIAVEGEAISGIAARFEQGRWRPAAQGEAVVVGEQTLSVGIGGLVNFDIVDGEKPHRVTVVSNRRLFPTGTYRITPVVGQGDFLRIDGAGLHQVESLFMVSATGTRTELSTRFGSSLQLCAFVPGGQPPGDYRVRLKLKGESEADAGSVRVAHIELKGGDKVARGEQAHATVLVNAAGIVTLFSLSETVHIPKETIPVRKDTATRFSFSGLAVGAYKIGANFVSFESAPGAVPVSISRTPLSFQKATESRAVVSTFLQVLDDKGFPIEEGFVLGWYVSPSGSVFSMAPLKEFGRAEAIAELKVANQGEVRFHPYSVITARARHSVLQDAKRGG